MLHTLTHNGYHGRTVLRIRGFHDGDGVEVSAAVARRLNRAVCGMADCGCGESAAWPLDGTPQSETWYVDVPASGDTVGAYPVR